MFGMIDREDNSIVTWHIRVRLSLVHVVSVSSAFTAKTCSVVRPRSFGCSSMGNVVARDLARLFERQSRERGCKDVAASRELLFAFLSQRLRVDEDLESSINIYRCCWTYVRDRCSCSPVFKGNSLQLCPLCLLQNTSSSFYSIALLLVNVFFPLPLLPCRYQHL